MSRGREEDLVSAYHLSVVAAALVFRPTHPTLANGSDPGSGGKTYILQYIDMRTEFDYI